MTERQISDRKSCLVLSARFSVANWRSRPVAKSSPSLVPEKKYVILFFFFWGGGGGQSLNFIIKTVGINWCVILCIFRSCGPFWPQSWCSREPMDFKKYYLWKNWVVPVLLLSFFHSFWIISNFCTADIIKKCLFVESPWLPGPNLADRPSVIQTKWGF